MTLIEYFGHKVKPRITRGKQMLAPLDSQKINNNIFVMRDKDCNAFIYKKDNSTIAFDCGYKNTTGIKNNLYKLGLSSNDVSDLFLTHLDLDHAGGVDEHSTQLYPRAKVYLGKIEERYLTRKLFRKKILFIGLKTPITLKKGYELLEDEQIVMIGNIKVQAILIPGHTLGHLCYLVDDKYLFTGDALLLVQGTGYAFYTMWNVNTKLLKKSLTRLQELKNIEMIITSHSGYTTDIKSAFLHIDTSPNWRKKGYKITDSTIINLYE